MAINHWPKQEQPREKLLHKGAYALSDAELLAIFIGNGVKGKTALDLARSLLNNAGSLRGILRLGVEEFCQDKGLGKVAYLRLQAALELSFRSLQEKLKSESILENSEETAAFLLAKLQNLAHEVFAILMLDMHYRIICFEILFSGTFDHSVVYPREIIKAVLACNATHVVFVHNHPSGELQPSDADIQLTKKLKHALGFVSVQVLDHYIVADNALFSFAEHGLI